MLEERNRYNHYNYNGNIISYRVHEVSEDSCAMEVYVMRYKDERQFYREERTDYTIYSNVYIKKIQEFNRQMQERCNIHGYDFPVNGDWDEKNAFLSEHYFVSVKNYDERVRQPLDELNKDAHEFYTEYHARFWGDDQNSVDNDQNEKLLKEAAREMKNAITSVECVNVGHGNFSIGYDDANNPEAVFDIGVPGKINSFLKDKINSLRDKGIVVISHYDSDHIKGFTKLHDEIRARLWILPERRKNPSSVERNFLIWLGGGRRIFLKNIDYSKTKFDIKKHRKQIGNISIFQGNAKMVDRNQSTAENARSLMCYIAGNKTALLPADTLYAEFPCGFSVDYLVIPHHCCEYQNPVSSGTLDLARIKRVIIFAGGHKGYHQPNITHLNKLGFSKSDKRIVYLLKRAIIFDGKVEETSWKPPITDPSYTIYL